MADNLSIAPEISLNDVSFANEQDNMLMRWSLVVIFFAYLSEFLDNAEELMIFELIKEMSCSKMEVPKKICSFVNRRGFFVELILLKKRERTTLTSLDILSENRKFKY